MSDGRKIKRIGNWVSITSDLIYMDVIRANRIAINQDGKMLEILLINGKKMYINARTKDAAKILMLAIVEGRNISASHKGLGMEVFISDKDIDFKNFD